MLLTKPQSEIRGLLLRQLQAFFPLKEAEVVAMDDAFEKALSRCDTCFSRVRNKYYNDASGASKFDPLHGCQWTAFLYYLSNTIYQYGGGEICDKIYLLLKTMSSADLFYQVELPDVFTFDHPMGSIIGRGSFQNYYTFSQGCTVGNNHGVYPAFGESVFMLSNSKVIGDTHIGNNVIIGANAYVKDADIPSGSLVFGQSPNLIIKEGRLDMVREYAEGVFRYE